jgi:hypothetical protein
MTAGRPAAPFPFIVGCDRSGTTLVRALLDAHPQMAVPPEGYFVAPLLSSRAEFESAGALDTEALLRALRGRERWQRWGIDEDTARAAFAADAPRDVPDAIRSLYSAYARQAGKTRYAEKTPRFVFSIRRIARDLPESVFLHVVRDGRDVALSRRAAGWSRTPTGTEALRWSAHVKEGRAQGRPLGQARYREIRYEDLVSDPEGGARGLCEFVGLDWDPQVLRYHEHARSIIDTSLRPDLHENIARPPTPGLRDWRSQMAPKDVRAYDAAAGATLRDFGYPNGSEAVGLNDRLNAFVTRARWKLARADRQLVER